MHVSAHESYQDLDSLLATDVNFMLGIWIEMARTWGATEQEVRYMCSVGV